MALGECFIKEWLQGITTGMEIHYERYFATTMPNTGGTYGGLYRRIYIFYLYFFSSEKCGHIQRTVDAFCIYPFRPHENHYERPIFGTTE